MNSPTQLAVPKSEPRLPKTEAAVRAIREARTVDEVKDIRDRADAVRLYAKRRGLGQEMIDDATEIVIHAERRAGEMLAGMEKAKGGRPSTTDTGRVSVSPSTLKEVGVTLNQSSRWQTLASVPEREFREAVEDAKREKRLSSAAVRDAIKIHAPKTKYKAPPPPAQLPARVEVHDAIEPWPVKDVDLIVTSPPYGLDKPYHGQDDPAAGWERFMRDWTKQAHKASAPNGRLALNVPLDTTRPIPRPTYAQAVQAAVASGWVYRFSIVWNEGNVSRSTGRGSVDSCGAPHCIAPVEMIAVFGAGVDWPIKIPSGAIDMTHEEWLAWTNGLWTFNGEGRAWEGHPAPFPEELPRRLIKLLSSRGSVVVDPFCGSGTTIKVAVDNERKAVGFDVSRKYVDSTSRRIASGT